MKILTLLALLVPILSGAALLVVRPQNRAQRNRYVLLTVCVSAVFVLGTALFSALRGPDTVYLHESIPGSDMAVIRRATHSSYMSQNGKQTYVLCKTWFDQKGLG